MGQAEERALLGVFEGDGLETAENDRVCDALETASWWDMGTWVGLDHWTGHTVGHHNRVLALDRFICDGCGEVNGQQDRVLLAPRWIEGGFKEHWEDVALQLSMLSGYLGAVSHSRPVLSKLLSASDSGYLEQACQPQLQHCGELPPRIDETYSFLIELTTARVNGEQEGVAEVIVE